MFLLVLQIITLVLLVFILVALIIIPRKQKQINDNLLATDKSLMDALAAHKSRMDVMSDRISELHERK